MVFLIATISLEKLNIFSQNCKDSNTFVHGRFEESAATFLRILERIKWEPLTTALAINIKSNLIRSTILAQILNSKQNKPDKIQ